MLASQQTPRVTILLALLLGACTSSAGTLDPAQLCDRVLTLQSPDHPDAASEPARRNCETNAKSSQAGDPTSYRTLSICVAQATTFDEIMTRCDGERFLGQLAL